MHPKFFIFSLSLFSLSVGCGEKTTDSGEPSAEPAGEPSSPSTEPSSEASAEPAEEPSSEPSEPSNPPIEDEDSDGFTREDGDCDDQDPDVYPGAEDIPGDGIDQDCDGSDAELTGRILEEVATGELIVTEVMNNPYAVGDDAGEWLEIFNNSNDAIDLNGLEVSDGGDDSFTVTENLTLPSREHIVFALSLDTAINGGVEASFAYTGFILSNSSDEVILSYNGRILDEMVYSADLGYGMSVGKSLSLDVDKYDFSDNDVAESWCPSPTEFGTFGDFGTPGEMNPTCPAIEDVDGDGFDNTSDCDDTDPTVNPVAMEIWYDGVDQNCNGDSDYDQDGDGEDSSDYSGGDCDDSDQFINTSAYDVPGNGVDEDCNGSDAESNGGASVADLIAGDLIVSEVMYNPSAVADSMGEWFEIYVQYEGTVNIGGLALCDNQGCASVSGSLEVASGDYVVFGNNGDTASNGGVTLNYNYGSGIAGLGNSGDMIELRYGATIIDVVDFSSGFPNLNGESMTLDPNNLNATANDDYFHWCAASSSFGAGDLGTPGASNDSCN